MKTGLKRFFLYTIHYNIIKNLFRNGDTDGMARYLLERIFQSAVVLLVMSFVLFNLMGLMPGDPIDLMISANPALTPSDGARLRTLYGLDTPLLERYWNWLTSILGEILVSLGSIPSQS